MVCRRLCGDAKLMEVDHETCLSGVGKICLGMLQAERIVLACVSKSICAKRTKNTVTRSLGAVQSRNLAMGPNNLRWRWYKHVCCDDSLAGGLMDGNVVCRVQPGDVQIASVMFFV